MSKYVKGFYTVEGCEETFNKIRDLQDKVIHLAGAFQNTQTLTELQIEYLEECVNDIVLGVTSSFEDLISKSEFSEDCPHTVRGYYEDFCPHKGYKKRPYCVTCKECLCKKVW